MNFLNISLASRDWRIALSVLATIQRFYFNDQLVQFFESESAKDLAAKVMDLACDPGKRNALRESALKFVEQKKLASRKE
jgi:hypothetical protein